MKTSKRVSFLKGAAVAMLTLGATAPLPQANAAGFPVTDLVQAINALRQILTQLEQYETQLEQALLEIRQARGLGQLTGFEDLEKLLALLEEPGYYGDTEVSQTAPYLDPQDPSYTEAVRTILSRTVTVPKSKEEAEAYLAEFKLENPENFQKAYEENARIYDENKLEPLRLVSQIEKTARLRDAQVKKLAEKLQALDADSATASIQFIAEVGIEQTAAANETNRILAQVLKTLEKPAAVQAEAIEAEMAVAMALAKKSSEASPSPAVKIKPSKPF